MAVILNLETHKKIYFNLKSIFSDFQFFDSLVANNLWQAIIDTNKIEINIKTTKKVVERYYDEDKYNTNELKLIWSQLNLIFKTCYVLIYSYHEEQQDLFWNDINTLLLNYPLFNKISNDIHELNLLLKFRNMLRITIELIPARLNKQIILKIAARLEGSQNEYITGNRYSF